MTTHILHDTPDALYPATPLEKHEYAIDRLRSEIGKLHGRFGKPDVDRTRKAVSELAELLASPLTGLLSADRSHSWNDYE